MRAWRWRTLWLQVAVVAALNPQQQQQLLQQARLPLPLLRLLRATPQQQEAGPAKAARLWTRLPLDLAQWLRLLPPRLHLVR